MKQQQDDSSDRKTAIKRGDRATTINKKKAMSHRANNRPLIDRSMDRLSAGQRTG